MQKARIPTVLSAITLAKKRYDGIIPVVSSIVGPFTLGAKLFGFDNFLTWIVLEPDTLLNVMELTTDLCAMYANEHVQAGSDVVQIGEASCSGDLISGASYGRYIAPFHNRLCASISAPTVVHICGNIMGHLEYIADTGMSGISMDEQADTPAAMKIVKGKTAVAGYVPTLDVLLNGSARDVETKSLECLAAGVDVLNAGCAWPPGVKSENIVVMIRAAMNSKPQTMN
jgi:[methyl-Co(III) methanol-specific corrinoid protein]:coenzyme M methyltransferase